MNSFINHLQKPNILRRVIQFGFAIVTIWIGIQFHLFVSQLENGANHIISRPPGAEGFLPISSLMSLKYWVLTGTFNRVHPSGLLIFIFTLVTAILLKRGFCSWVCPAGLLNEFLSKVHKLLFDKPRSIWKWLDYPLRSIKYLLLFFFLYAIIIQMDVPALKTFIYSPYNKVADIKMLLFFTNMSALTAKVLIGLVLLSILVRNFWCRYLCPYGALLGMTSWLSVFKIQRDENSCIDCEKCTKVCPVNIKVHKPKTVFSDECHGCLQCVQVCPVENTLTFSAAKKKFNIKPAIYGAIIIGIFLGGSVISRLLGVWQNNITLGEYKYHIKNLDHPAYDHNRGQVPEYEEIK
jgi:polyferredoxin